MSRLSQIIICIPMVMLAGCGKDKEATVEPAQHLPADVTFSEHIAPIVFENCAVCHRPGEAGPFPLLSYDDVKKHAEDIVDVTSDRYMPPWLPTKGDYPFQGERTLTDDQIAVIAKWVESGSAQGPAEALPDLPEWTEGWQLGEPDVLLELTDTYTLQADGSDVFRNFVFDAPPEVADRYVRAVELRPGNPAVVHHAFMGVDESNYSRRLDAQDEEIGFEGMEMGYAAPPEGHMLGWTPGKMPHPGFLGMAWQFVPGTNLVLQLHLRPSGKPEPVRPVVGLFLDAKPPTKMPYGLLLKHEGIDIPAGDSNHVLEQEFVMPVDAALLSIYPHAHYIGKQFKVTAGDRVLLDIPDWDFNWQDQYHYKSAPLLRKGTTLRVHISYDNSADNPRNPNNPPKRVQSGNNSTDEMGNVWLQLLPNSPEGLAALKLAGARHAATHERTFVAFYNYGNELQKIGEHADALRAFESAYAIDAEHPLLHHNYAGSLAATGRLDDAIRHMQEAIRLDADYSSAHLNLGHFFAMKKDYGRAMDCYRKTLELDPANSVARKNLEILEKAGRQP